jgi:hypothetical protein
MNPTCELVGLGQRIQKLGTDGSFSGSVGTDIASTSAVAFEVDSGGTEPAMAIGSQAAGTGNFTQTIKPATTLTASFDILTIDLAADAEMMLQASGVILNTITDFTNANHDHANAAGGGAIVATALSGTTSDTWEINSDGFGAILDTTGLSQDSTFTFPDEAGPDELMTIAGTQTGTNKTFTSPTITGMTATGASTLESCVIGGVTPADATVTTFQATGEADLDGEVKIGAGYGSTGVTITTGGNISANGTLSVDGIADFTSIVGSDASLGITGIAGSAGNGGAVAIAGGNGDANNNGGAAGITGGTGDGAGTGDGGAVNLTGGGSGGGATGAGGVCNVAGGSSVATDGAGGATSTVGGNGNGTGAGGDLALAGGDSGGGATGNGGAAVLEGGAATSTAGNGGEASLIGGVSTTTGTGGAVTITSGASEGAAGTAGAVAIDTGAATGGTGGALTIGTANAASVAIGVAATGATTTLNGAVKGEAEGHIVHTLVVDATAAEINADEILVTVPAGLQFQLVDIKQIAIGGNAATATAVTVAGSATLTSTTVGALTRSTVVQMDTVGVTVLADAASFAAQTAGTDITAANTGVALDGATSIRFIISYLLV